MSIELWGNDERSSIIERHKSSIGDKNQVESKCVSTEIGWTRNNYLESWNKFECLQSQS